MTPYSYTPKRLVESFQALKVKEEKEEQHLVIEETSTTTDEVKVRTTCVSNDNDDSIIVAAVQLTASGLKESTIDGFWERSQSAIHQAATTKNAQIILLPELFLGPYFCQSQEATLLSLSINDIENSFIIKKLSLLAKQYNVTLPISIFERKNNALYNSIVVIDTDGTIIGSTYRKSHIPDGTGYQEKFYFSPGDSGFMVYKSNSLNITIGIAICWDQWFPEAARIMALKGADVIFYPTAIGTEPQDPTLDSVDHWQRVMQGHSAANMIPIVASNRYGTEILLNDDGKSEKQRIHFYGRSFITNETGAIVEEAEMDENDITTNDGIAIITSTIHPNANRSTRLAWGLFRDRRPELYGPLLTKDGVEK